MSYETTSNDTDAGIRFLVRHPAYKIQSAYDEFGLISLQLVKVGTGLGDLLICNLDMKDIYAQCTPSRITHKLKILVDAAHEVSTAINNDVHALETTNTIPDVPF